MASSTEPLLSEFASDPDMQELVAMFVDDLPERVSALERAIEQEEAGLEDLIRLAHQLKGAAGGYGFMPITDAAREVESLARAGGEVDALRVEVDQLVDLCRRARS